LHFHTKTTIDTLDYSGDEINAGSKLIIAAYGDKKRELKTELPQQIFNYSFITKPIMLMDGVIGVELKKFTDYKNAKIEIGNFTNWLSEHKNDFEGIVQIIIYDDFMFTPQPKNLNDYVWITYTRSNPSHDVYGVDEFTQNKHWGCHGAMIIDARKKPHHAPELKVLEETKKSIERFF